MKQNVYDNAVKTIISANPLLSFIPEKRPCRNDKVFFQLNPPLRVGEILLRNLKSSLCSNEIAAAVGGFNFT